MKNFKLLGILLISMLLGMTAVIGIGAADDVVYVVDGGKGDGSSPTSPFGDLADAFVALPYGGTIVVCGDYTLANSVNYDASVPAFTSPSADGTITITGKYGGTNYNGRLVFAAASRYFCTADTVFENITFYNGSKKTLVIAGRFFNLTFGEGCNMDSIEVHVVGGMEHTNAVVSVPDDDYSKDTYVTVKSGKIAELTGLGRNVSRRSSANYTGTSHITITDEAVVDKVFGAYCWGSKAVTGGTAIITLDGGSVTNFITGCGRDRYAYNVDVTIIVTEKVNPDNYFKAITPGWGSDGAFRGINAGAIYNDATNYGDTYIDLTKATQLTKEWVEIHVCFDTADTITGYKETNTNRDVVFLSDNGSDDNDGSSFSKPLQSITKAFKLLGNDGGTIVICNAVTIDTTAEATFPTHDGQITITSIYEGVDYRETGASLAFNVDVYLGGDTLIEKIDISNTSGAEFYCRGNSLHLGEEITTTYASTPMAIWGGMDCAVAGVTLNNLKFYDYTIQIDSGDWHYVRGGSIRTGESQYVGIIGNVTIIINGGRITNTTTSPTMNGIIAVAGFDALDGDANIIINGGEINCSVMGLGRPGTNATSSNSAYANGNVNITINGGTFRSGITVGAIHDVVAAELNGDFTLAVSGGTFGDGFKGFDAQRVLGTATLITCGNDSYNEVEFDKTVRATSTAQVEAEINAIKADQSKTVVLPDVKAESDVIYICDGGEGDGSTPSKAMSDIVAASEKLKEGGTIVVCGKYSVDTGKTLRISTGKITLTSTYGGVDYAKLNNAHIELTKYISFKSSVLIENIKFVSKGNDCYISGEGNEFTIGENVVCEIFKGNRTEDYPALIAGSFSISNSFRHDIHMTVKSGTWGCVSGAQYSTVDNSGITRRVEGNIVIDIYGGKFADDFFIAGKNNLNGNATLNAYGGTFACSVFGLSGEEITANGNVTINAYDADFQGDIRAAQNDLPTLNGKYVLNVHDANIDRVSVIVGAEKLGGENTSEINVAENRDLTKPLTGDLTYQNPIAGFADPSIVYHDGYYYYTYAKYYLGADAIYMAKAANLGDIGKVEPILIWSSVLTGEAKEMSALWAPQLYFIEDRWYIYAAVATIEDAATGANLRFPYVWVGQPDDPTGPYTFFGCMENLDPYPLMWLSPRVIKHDGHWYMFNSGFYHSTDTNPHLQRMRIVKLESPTKMETTSVVISTPEYDYEAGIMEGPYPFYGPDGTLYLIFAAGHTRTDLYCTGIMRFNGTESDSLLDVDKWEKFPEPLQYTNYDNFVYSPGAMVVTTSPDGSKYYGVYHAKEYHYSAYTMRRMHMQEIYFDENGFPYMDDPQPISTTFTMQMNSMPISKRISGFTSEGKLPASASAGFNKSRTYENNFTDVIEGTHWFHSYVKTAYEYALANGTSQTKFSPDSSFTVAQALTAAVNIHTAYYGNTVRAAASGEKWYTPYVEYCVSNNIITATQFDNVDRSITRGEMAIVFANILPSAEYEAVRSGSNPDVTSDMACFSAVQKLYNAGIVGGDAGTGNYRPNDSIKRSEACVIFTRIAAKEYRAK